MIESGHNEVNLLIVGRIELSILGDGVRLVFEWR